MLQKSHSSFSARQGTRPQRGSPGSIYLDPRLNNRVHSPLRLDRFAKNLLEFELPKPHARKG
jgi:hypothetical protein